MAVVPLFIGTIAELKQRLRLSGVNETDDAQAIIEDAVREVRLGLIDDLGLSLITTLVAVSFTETPATSDEVRRFRAEMAELFWIRALLVERLPQLFVDSSGTTKQVWNDDGLVRDVGTGSIRRQARDLMRKVRDYVAFLNGTDTGELTIFVAVPDTAPQRPGDSIKPPVTGGPLLP